jgi:hypothetical protein
MKRNAGELHTSAAEPQPARNFLPLMNTDNTDQESGHRVIGASGDQEKQRLPRINADERGSKK